MASSKLFWTDDAGGPISAALDKGTFPWYKRDNVGGVKSLILRVFLAVPDNPFLGTKCPCPNQFKCCLARCGEGCRAARNCHAVVVLRRRVLIGAGCVSVRTAAEDAVIAGFHPAAVGRYDRQPELQ